MQWYYAAIKALVLLAPQLLCSVAAGTVNAVLCFAARVYLGNIVGTSWTKATNSESGGLHVLRPAEGKKTASNVLSQGCLLVMAMQHIPTSLQRAPSTASSLGFSCAEQARVSGVSCLSGSIGIIVQSFKPLLCNAYDCVVRETSQEADLGLRPTHIRCPNGPIRAEI